MPTAAQPLDLLDLKRNLPTELRTAELSRLDEFTRERAFYMSGVTEAEILQEMRTMVARSARGEAGEYELRKEWEAFLNEVDYKALPGQEGTIKDLRSLRRFNVALRTNLRLMRGWALKENGRSRGELLSAPGWELVRIRDAKVPREWIERFIAAGGTLYEGRMIGAKLSDVWEKLGSLDLFDDALGVDYPPFAWASGMSWKPVYASEMIRLGAMTMEEIRHQAAMLDAQPMSSPNESLQSTPMVTDRDLRDDLTQKLGGLARWDRDVLVMTDPNGTRPVTQAELIETWSRPLPEKFRSEEHPDGLFQKTSLKDWVSDHDNFEKQNATDRWEDLQRLMGRLENTVSPARLERGMQVKESDLEGFLANLRKSGYGVRPQFPAESWTDSPAAARRYAGVGEPGSKVSVIIEILDPPVSDFKDISALVRWLASRREVTKLSTPPVQTESEWLLRAGRKYPVHRIKRDRKSGLVRITLQLFAR